jgi:hypothetical protein
VTKISQPGFGANEIGHPIRLCANLGRFDYRNQPGRAPSRMACWINSCFSFSRF